MDKVTIIQKLSSYKELLEKAASTIDGLQTQVKEKELRDRVEKVAMQMMDKGLIDPSEFLAKRAELVENIEKGEDIGTLERAVEMAKEGGTFVVGRPDTTQPDPVAESERIKQEILDSVI